jgi:hypothetical protein
MLLVFLATRAFADPILESEQVNIEGGLTVVSLFLNGNDGQLTSFYVDLSFTSTGFNEVPGFGGVDITTSKHFLWDNRLGGSNDDYVDNRTRDSFFYTYTGASDLWSGLPPCNGVTHPGSGSYRVCLGTTPGEGALRLILGQLVVPTGETVFFEGEIARSGITFPQNGAFTTVPEPSSFILVSGGLLFLAASSRPSGRLRFRAPRCIASAGIITGDHA